MKDGLVSNKKVLVYGAKGFTGKHLVSFLKSHGYSVFSSDANILDKVSIEEELKKIVPDFVVNLAAISFVAHKDSRVFYDVNVIGCLNILDMLLKLKQTPKKIILSSSAIVYGNQQKEFLDEGLCPLPVNHYGASKLAMEHLSCGYFDKLNIIITRPFNYTGVGQDEKFLIPKIVNHYKNNSKTIELGNLDVEREFNDIEYVCRIYQKLLEIEVTSEIVNVCSKRTIKLLDIIELMNKIAGYEIEVKVNPAFVRKNEIKVLGGDPKKLFTLIGKLEQKSFEETLKNMYFC